ncbi:MAG: hypothetical protein U0271_34405 [Polyangiaceae bacterium]
MLQHVFVRAVCVTFSLCDIACAGTSKEPDGDRTQTVSVDVVHPAASASTSAPKRAHSFGIVEVALGDQYTCARSDVGEVYCWGSNEFGVLGDPGVPDQHRPRRVQLPRPAIQVGTGNYCSCALLDNHQVACWGSREKGNIGDGQAFDGPPTAPVTLGLTNITRLAVEEAIGYAIDDQGVVFTWGPSRCVSGVPRSPKVCEVLQGASTLRESAFVGCWTNASGETRCWGGFVNNCGNPVNRERKPPGQLISLPGPVKDIAPEISNVCALLEGGEVYCWGDTQFGDLGCPASPKKLPGLANVTSFRVFLHTLCAIHSDGSVSCAGDNRHGILANRTLESRSTFAPIEGLSNVKQLDLDTHACAVTKDHKLFCWGENDRGQLGDGTIQQRLTPVEVVFDPGWGRSQSR